MIIKLTFLFVYIGVTYWLSFVGMKKTKSLKGFAVGNRDMSPYIVGITLSASISSTATFVINPGFVYVDGLSAFLHYGFAAPLGIVTALFLLTKKFRDKGETSITIPHWIHSRFKSRGLSVFFAVINLLSITFVVLILVGCAILLSTLLGISQNISLILILLFVFSYVLMGGCYAHAYTNTFQGLMMMGIALFIFFNGLHYFSGGVLESLRCVSENYASVFNPGSRLYYDFFSVFASSFIITFSLMLQPHILTKVLFLKDSKDTNRFLLTAIVSGFAFSLMLFVGFYARLGGMEIASQDSVVATYLYQTFSSSGGGVILLSFITIALLAAGMSTLDGILVSLSSMVVNDLVLPFSKHPEKANGLLISRVLLVCIGVFSCALAWSPPTLVGIFAQQGVYGLAAASVVPILFGTLLDKNLPVWALFSASFLGVASHFILNLGAGIVNPSVSASCGILISVVYMWIVILFTGRKK